MKRGMERGDITGECQVSNTTDTQAPESCWKTGLLPSTLREVDVSAFDHRLTDTGVDGFEQVRSKVPRR